MRPPRGFLWLWLLLTFVWIAISSSLAIESVAAGTLISAAMAYVFARKFEIWRGIRFSPQRLYHFILYTGVFLVELVRANINMMRYVYAPRVEHQSRRRKGEDRIEIAHRPARFGELDQPNAWFARPRYERGGAHGPLSRHADYRR